MTNAGSRPAANNRVTDRLAMAPRMTISSAGGTRMPMAEAALTIETLSSLL